MTNDRIIERGRDVSYELDCQGDYFACAERGEGTEDLHRSVHSHQYVREGEAWGGGGAYEVERSNESLITHN